MKKNILALAAALVASGAFATTPVPATGSVVGSATSQVGGSVQSYSFGTGIGISARHSATASAQNCSVAAGYSLPGTNGAQAGTLAYTAGTTYTAASGTGSGYAGSNAFQFGSADVTATANVGAGMPATGSTPGSNPYGAASATSLAMTGTFSNATVGNTGFAESSSAGGAENQTDVLVGSSLTSTGVSTRAEGTTTGSDYMTTAGRVEVTGTGNTASIDAGGILALTIGETVISNVGSFQNGTFAGFINRSFANITDGTGGPGGCKTGDCPDGGGGGDNGGGKPDLKGNNGWGNGNQAAPGASLNHNNAENNGKGTVQKNHPGPVQN